MPSRRDPDPFAAQLGARIRQIRKERQMSLHGLARVSGLSRGHLSDIERGKVVMTVGTLGTVAGALEVPAFILCLIPKDDPGAAVMDEALLMAQGDPKKAAKTIRRLVLETLPGPQEDDKPPASESAMSSETVNMVRPT